MNFLKKFLNLDKSFSEVIIDKQVISTMIKFAKTAYPKEFIAFLQGIIKEEKLLITSLTYQHFYASEKSAFTQTTLPLTSNIVGTIHSHPIQSKPSKTDLKFFNKNYIIHIIISYPFNINAIKIYNKYGEEIKFMVKFIKTKN